MGRIGGGDCFAAVQPAIRLIKIYCLRDVRWDYRIVLVASCDAVHLHGQEHGDFVLLQLFGERDDCGSAPAMAIENYASLGSLGVCKLAGLVCVE